MWYWKEKVRITFGILYMQLQLWLTHKLGNFLRMDFLIQSKWICSSGYIFTLFEDEKPFQFEFIHLIIHMECHQNGQSTFDKLHINALRTPIASDFSSRNWTHIKLIVIRRLRIQSVFHTDDWHNSKTYFKSYFW